MSDGAEWPEVFWSKVDRSDPDGCWPWIAGRSGGGYGEIYVDGQAFRSHRVAWILENGSIPEGLVVRHLCNNKICCRPDHLTIGTQRDNMDDMVRADRQPKGEEKWNTVLTETQVLDIFARCQEGGRGVQSALSREYGVSRSTANDILTGRTWAWLTGARGEDA